MSEQLALTDDAPGERAKRLRTATEKPTTNHYLAADQLSIKGIYVRLSAAQIREIKAKREQNVSVRRLSLQYGVGQATIVRASRMSGDAPMTGVRPGEMTPLNDREVTLTMLANEEGVSVERMRQVELEAMQAAMMRALVMICDALNWDDEVISDLVCALWMVPKLRGELVTYDGERFGIDAERVDALCEDIYAWQCAMGER